MLTTQRLINQGIASPVFDTSVDALMHLGAIQGQDYAGAKWSLGLRVPNSTETSIEQALSDKYIVRTWLMRGTIFLLAARDLRWMLDLMRPRVIKQFQRRYKQLELNEATLVRSQDILIRALQDNTALSRRDLYSVLEEQGISTTGQRGFYITRHASLQGAIVHAQVDKNDPIFVAVDESFDKLPTLPRDQALVELARRYFRSHGPATEADFGWWSGLLKKDVRGGIAGIQDELEIIMQGDMRYYVMADEDTADAPTLSSPAVHALPGFDEYYLGYQNRALIVDPQHAEAISPGKNGVFYRTVVIDGQIRGTWKRTIHTDAITVEVTPFTPLTVEEQAGFAAAMQRYSTFMGRPVKIGL